MDDELDILAEERKKSFLRVAITLAVTLAVLMVLVAAGWFGRPVYRHYREQNAVRLAQAFFAKGDYRNAALSARQALQFSPTNVPACRVMAALADLSRNPAALDWLRHIVQIEPSVENKLQLAAAGLRYQNPPFPLTGQILNELAPAATNLASYQVLAAGWAVRLRHPDQAEAHFETATRLDPTNQLYAMNLAVVRLDETNELKAAQARAELETLRTDPVLGPAALRALVVDRLAHGDAAAANAYSTQLLAGAQVTLADQLQHLGIARQLKSADFESQLQAVQSQAQTNDMTVAEMAEWMEGNGLQVEDLRWLTNLPAALRAQPPVRLALADAYLQGSDWRALRDFVSEGNWEEMEFLRLALVARAWSQLGARQVADSNWGAAISEAGTHLGALTTLLRLTEEWKMPLERENLLARIVDNFPHERWAQESLEQLYLAEGNTAGLNRLFAKLVPIFPHEAGLKNDLAYTSLLLKTNLPQACQWAAEIYAGKTNDPVIAATYALALQMQGRPKDGVAVLRKLNDRQLRQPDIALYYGVLLAAIGDANDAAPFLKIARTKTQWLPEEEKLLTTAGKF